MRCHLVAEERLPGETPDEGEEAPEGHTEGGPRQVERVLALEVRLNKCPVLQDVVEGDGYSGVASVGS
jgi:hypothetical protein